jgi:hypothetical protein
MAEEKKSESPSPAKAEKAVDLVTEIGTLTYPRAVQHFGKDRAIDAMQRVAAIGGHGLFEEDELKSPLFGGLAMPSPDTVIKLRVKRILISCPKADFYYHAAMEDFEEHENHMPAESRAAINDLYASLKANG